MDSEKLLYPYGEGQGLFRLRFSLFGGKRTIYKKKTEKWRDYHERDAVLEIDEALTAKKYARSPGFTNPSTVNI